MPATRPPASPQPICAAALLTTAEVTPVSSSALAMSSATRKNGTARPSLSPLSTSSACRTRAGTDVSVTTFWPSAASVEASIVESRTTDASAMPGKTSAADPDPGDHRERQPDEQQPARPAELVAERAQVEAGGVAEQQQHERHLGDALGDGGLDGDVEPAERRGADDEAGRR